MLKSKTYLKSTPYITFDQVEIFSGSFLRGAGEKLKTVKLMMTL